MSKELKDKALRMLARREHSRAELARKLGAEADGEELRALLDRLEETGLLSDARYAEAYVAARGARFGAARLRHDLRASGVGEEIIEAVLPADAGEEIARAREVWRRRFAAPATDRAGFARQARFLLGRGFAMDVIRKVLKEQE